MSIRAAAKALLPADLRKKLQEQRRSDSERGREEALGAFLLSAAAEFARERGGDAAALNAPALTELIKDRATLKRTGEALQLLQTAFMPSYEQHLYEYYRQLQYQILLTFLSYPYRGVGGLDAQLVPYETGAAALGEMDVLDYGAGVPYGLIELLRTQPGKVRSVTICDLDLIHVSLVEFILRKFLPADRVRVLRSRDSNALPDLSGVSFNFCFGKDIFEHLLDPEPHLKNILAVAREDAVCMLDFTDHGERHLQHVTPFLSPLAEVMSAAGFTYAGKVKSLSAFTRGAAALKAAA